MSIEHFTLITPIATNVALPQPQEQITAYEGRQIIRSYGISAEGAGTYVEGRLSGTLQSYDYKAIYQVYNLTDRDSVDAWIAQYRQDTTRAQLKQAAEEAVLVSLDYDFKFRIEGNNLGISGVYITYRAIRLEYEGQTKDFIVATPANAEAITPQGQRYPGQFTPIE